MGEPAEMGIPTRPDRARALAIESRVSARVLVAISAPGAARAGDRLTAVMRAQRHGVLEIWAHGRARRLQRR